MTTPMCCAPGGRPASSLGGTVKASIDRPWVTFLRSFRWGHVRQLDRVSRELLARAWQAGAGPGDGPLTIDLDSTICETYGLAKEGARHHGYSTGKRGYHLGLFRPSTCRGGRHRSSKMRAASALSCIDGRGLDGQHPAVNALCGSFRR